MNAARRRKARREWDALTGGPLPATWWATKAGLRAAFVEMMFMALMLLNNNTNALSAIVGGEASVFSLAALTLVTPEYLAIAGVVFAAILLFPFSPRRNEATSRWEQAVACHRDGR